MIARDKDLDFSLILAVGPALCVMCSKDDSEREVLINDGLEVLTNPANPLDPQELGVCEPCSYLASWRWRQMSDNAAIGPPFPTEPTVVMVVVVRERKVTSLTKVASHDSEEGVDREVTMPDPVAPYDTVMVTRKEEPWAFALPGGKVERGEDPTTTAVRELYEETNLHTWPSALEVLHDGFTARGKLARVYMCRAYAGDLKTKEEGVNAEWKAGSIVEHAGSYKGFYFGADNAFKMKTQIQTLSGARVPLCTRFGKAGKSYVDVLLSFEPSTLSKEDRSLLKGYRYAMTEEEGMASEFVCRHVQKAPVPRPEVAVVEGSEADVVGDDNNDDIDGGGP